MESNYLDEREVWQGQAFIRADLHQKLEAQKRMKMQEILQLKNLHIEDADDQISQREESPALPPSSIATSDGPGSRRASGSHAEVTSPFKRLQDEVEVQAAALGGPQQPSCAASHDDDAEPRAPSGDPASFKPKLGIMQRLGSAFDRKNSKKKILLPLPLNLKLEPLRVKVYDEYCKAYCANCGVPTWCDAALWSRCGGQIPCQSCGAKIKLRLEQIGLHISM